MPTKFRMFGQDVPASSDNSTEQIPAAVNAETGSIPETAPVAGSLFESPTVEQVGSYAPVLDPGEDRNANSGIHGIVKSTDFWFNIELSQLEKHAVMMAGLHAQAGLPRQDVPAAEELPIETTLRIRAVELFLEWIARVRRKVQDGIQSSCVAVGDELGQLRHALAHLEVTNREIRNVESELRGLQSGAPAPEKTVEFGRLLRRWCYFVLLAMLIIVDWVANVPVFTELLPKEPGSEQRWQDIVANSERYGWSAGLHRLGDRILFSPDVSLLALGVIVFLMVLCHFCGTSLRRLIAFRPQDESSPALDLESHRRQAWLPFGAGAVGISLVLAFLFLSRGQIERMTQVRLYEANAQVAAIEQQRADAKAKNDFDKESLAERQLEDARAIVEERNKSVIYASGISAMNLPIFLLNLTLVITAASAAYLDSSARIVEARMVNPRIAELRERLRTLRYDVPTQKARLRALDSEIQANIAKTRYLAQSLPLRDWEAKAKRLEAVVPLFRAENARQRGIDVQNIKGFQQQIPLELPSFSEDASLRLPEDLAKWENEFGRLRSQIEAFQSRSADSNSGGDAL